MILLDADVVVDLLRRHPAAIAWAQSHRDEQLSVPGYTAMELINGCRDLRQLNETNIALRNYRIVWPAASSCQLALSVFGRLHLSDGTGALDVLNAYTAIELNAALHTFNVKHYRSIPMLRIVQPYSR